MSLGRCAPPQLRDKIGVGSDLGRAIEVGFDSVYTVSDGVEFVRVLKAGFGRAAEVKFDCTNLTWATEAAISI